MINFINKTTISFVMLLTFVFNIQTIAIENQSSRNTSLKGKHKSRNKKILGSNINSWEPEQNTSLYNYTRKLNNVTTVEVIKGFNAMIEGENKLFFKVQKKITISENQLQNLLSIWKTIKRGEGMGCWNPHHVLKFYSDDNLILESEICFECHIITFNSWSDRSSFDASGKSGIDLYNAIENILKEASN
jgi:hypothetical protein